jgi:transcriptional regulator with XRE-family HTH domain
MAKYVKESFSEEHKFHYKMRALRLALGVTQEEIAELVGVSTVLISMFERGIVGGETLKNNVNTSLSTIRDRLIEKYGYWFDAYVELKTNINLMDIWIEFEGHAPMNVIRKAKESAAAFVHI